MPFDAEPSVEVTARDRLIRLRDFLKTLLPSRFDMSDPGVAVWSNPECESAACIGGWARSLFCRREPEYINLEEVGIRYLGLGIDDTYNLFYPCTYDGNAMTATTKQAVRVLDHLLATGEVNWSVAFEKGDQ